VSGHGLELQGLVSEVLAVGAIVGLKVLAAR
jgi:hypothetical protein